MNGNSLLNAAMISGWVISCPPYSETCPSFLAASIVFCHSACHFGASAAGRVQRLGVVR